MNGIDISSWQPANITEIVNYDFVIIKATEGTNYVSPVCDQQYQHAKKRGKLLGVYHFASGGDAVAEADFFIKNVAGYIGEAVLALDWEGDAVARGGEWVRAFVRRVKEKTGVPPLIYGSRSPLATAGIPAIAAAENCGLWVAAYPNSSRIGYVDEPQLLGSVIRQYTSAGLLPGYAGNLDLNRSILSPDQWRAYARGGSAKKNDVVPTPAPSAAPAASPDGKTHIVKSGDTLSAIAAAHGLTLAQLLDINPQFRANPNLIHPGQVVQLDGAAPSRVYTVVSGDTLSGIAARHGLSLEQLLAKNPQFRANPNLIHPGDRLEL